jgi:hypothetical protein|tara:strand:- start:1327 stop:1539 length:213 start_codon:yes stop_codon:yes gene_type:complete
MQEIKRDCKVCDTSYIVTAKVDDVCRWQNGGIIQDVMPYLSADERELLISGTCGSCFDEKFPPYPLDNED